MFTLTDKGTSGLAAGSYPAICVQVIELGTHINSYGKEQPKVQLVFELPEELNSEGQPLTRFVQYTLALGTKANLRKELEKWRAQAFTPQELEGFTLDKILGAHALLSINDEGYINGISSLPKGMPKKVPVNPLIYFELFGTDEFDQHQFDALNEYVKKNIAKSPEFAKFMEAGKAKPFVEGQKAGSPAVANSASDDDDLPF